MNQAVFGQKIGALLQDLPGIAAKAPISQTLAITDKLLVELEWRRSSGPAATYRTNRPFYTFSANGSMAGNCHLTTEILDVHLNVSIWCKAVS